MLLFLFIIVFSLCCDFQFIVVIVVELVFLTHSFPLPPWPFYPFQLIKRKLGSDFLGIHVKHPVWFTICYFNGGKTKYEIKSENNKNVKRKEGKIENCLRKQASVFPWVFFCSSETTLLNWNFIHSLNSPISVFKPSVASASPHPAHPECVWCPELDVSQGISDVSFCADV